VITVTDAQLGVQVVYITYFVPVLLLSAILVRVLIIDNVAERAVMYVWEKTDWEKMLLPSVGCVLMYPITIHITVQFWTLVISQALYACGMGFGAFITLASYNNRQNNLVCDSVLIIISHLLTSAMTLMLVLGLGAYVGGRWQGQRSVGDFLAPDCERFTC
jgi:SNF family Na+-dependent transporter